MSSLADLLKALWRNYAGRQNGRLLLRFLGVFMVCVWVYSLLFHVVMAYEGRSFDWLSGLYWTLIVMSTLGLGDITFTSNVGQLFTIGVLLSGLVFFLVLLPLLFMEGQSASRVPRDLPKDTTGHIILCAYDAVTSALMTRLAQYHYPYVLLVSDLSEALRLHDAGLRVVVGEIDHPETFRRVQLSQAALVATTASDPINTNVVFTVRDLSSTVPVIATASDSVAVQMLTLAGSSHVLHLGSMLGQSLARRIHGGKALAHVIGQYDELLIAEAATARTALVGDTLRHSRLREKLGLSVVGVWERGHFEMAGPETRISPHTVLVLAGSQPQLDQFEAQFAPSDQGDIPVLILGGGRVGQAIGWALQEREVLYRIVEQLPERVQQSEHYVLGNAADAEVLRKAGIQKTPAVVITTHDDDLNIYLTLYCRHFRPDVQIISRATLEHNVATLHRAGADFVMSYASMGANTIWNLVQRSDVFMVTEGLQVFKVPLPLSLIGKTMADSAIWEETGCHIIAVQTGEQVEINPDPMMPLAAETELILIGTTEDEQSFLQVY